MKYITLFLLIEFLIAPKIIGQEDLEYFEGEVHFKISVKSLDENLPTAILEQELGNKLIGKVKEKKYLMLQNSSGELGNMKMIYLLEEGIGYIEYENRDTIEQFRIDTPPGELLEVKKNKEPKKEILGKLRESITIRYKPEKYSEYIDEISGTYYYHSDYKLNPAYYKNHKSEYWNLFVNESESISIRNEIVHYPLLEAIYEAEQIIVKEIGEEEFEIDKTRPIKIID